MTYMFNRSSLSRVGMLAWAMALLAVCPRDAAAQTCDQARKTMLTNNAKRVDLYNASLTIVGCGDLAPGTIASALRRASANSMLDSLVRFDAYMLLDRRLADSVRVLARDQSQGKPRRTLYLQLLTRYAAPGAGVDTGAFAAQRFTAIVAQPHADGVPGTQPITASDRANVRATILDMAINDADATLRELATMVYHDLGSYPP